MEPRDVTLPFTGACREVVELVTRYLDGALEAPTERLFEAHLAQCDGCRAYVDQIVATVDAVGRLRVEALPAATQRAIVEAFRDLHPPASRL